jgi:hypothetical protein
MTTKTSIIASPEDIPCPDSVINGWLYEWNKTNVDPVTLEQVEDMTFDFIFRAVDYGANQELHRVMIALAEIHPQGKEISSQLLKRRRPVTDTPERQIIAEIEIFEQFVMAEMKRLKDELLKVSK